MCLLWWHLLARRVPCRLQEQHRLESSAHLTNLCCQEASFQNCCSRLAVPMAIAHAARRHGDQRILDPRGYLALRPHMFEEQQAASRFEYAPDLAQAALWITYRTEDERDHRTIERRIGERE